jgi:hypothetical protein
MEKVEELIQDLFKYCCDCSTCQGIYFKLKAELLALFAAQEVERLKEQLEIRTIARYKVVIASSASALSKIIETALTEGLPNDDFPYKRDNGWVLSGGVTSSQSSGKDARGYPFTDVTYSQALIIYTGCGELYWPKENITEKF